MSKEKNGFPSAYTILFILTVAVGLLTYIIPTGQYDYITENTKETISADNVSSYSGEERLLPIPGTYQEIDSHNIGIKDILLAPIKGIASGIDIIVFLLAIGSFITMTMNSGALDAYFSRIIKKYEGREKLMIPLLIFLFSLGGATFGLSEETVAFYPLLIPIMLRAGFDSFVGISVIIVGSVMGIMGALTNPFSVGIASGFAGISIADGLGLRVIIFITTNVLASVYILRYASKIQKNPLASLTIDEKASIEKKYLGSSSSDALSFPEFNTRRKIIMSIFALTFLILVWGVLPWDNFGFPSLYLGWWFNEFSALFFVSSVLIGIAAGYNEKTIIQNITQGVSDFIPVGLVIGVARGVISIMDQGMIKDTLLHFAESSMSSSMGPVALALVVFLTFIPLSFFITSSSGLATLTMPIITPVAQLAGLNPALIVIIYVFSMGLLNITSPADPILNAAITMSGSTYKRWITFIAPLALMLFVVIWAYIIIASFIF